MAKKKFKDHLKILRKLKPIVVVLLAIAWLQFQTLTSMGSTPSTGATHRFVQLENGKTIEAHSVPGIYRTDAVVSRFVSDLVTLGYKWDRDKQDIQSGDYYFPAGYHLASNVMQSDAQTRWLRNFLIEYGPGLDNASTPRANRRELNYHVILTQAPKVNREKPGWWTVGVEALRLVTDRQNAVVGKETLSFEFKIAAVNPGVGNTWFVKDPILAQKMEELWSDGLVVTDYVDLRVRG